VKPAPLVILIFLIWHIDIIALITTPPPRCNARQRLLTSTRPACFLPPIRTLLLQVRNHQKPWDILGVRPLRAGTPTSAPVSLSARLIGHESNTDTQTGNVNSPQVLPEVHNGLPHEHASYQQRVDGRASAIAAVETAKHSRRRDAALSRLYNVFDGRSDSGDQKPYTHTAITKDEDGDVAQPEQPSTPKKKRVPILWHGLPSPETPTFHRDAGTTTSVADSTQTELVWQASFSPAKRFVDQVTVSEQSRVNTDGGAIDDAKPTFSQTLDQSTHDDAMLARELEQALSPSSTRRSTRLRKQPKPICKCHVCQCFQRIC